uniref:OCA domain-containing protein n=1 Tax=Electrophorus electricus TaxID=8005 RepID=A0A4W4E5N0_ELEEL
MVRSGGESAVCERMPVSQECGDEDYGIYLCKGSPFAGTPASSTSGPNSPTSALRLFNVELCFKAQKSKPDKRYLGVRVRMPVRDLLRNIRIAKGMDPKELQVGASSSTSSNKKRVNTSGDRRKRLKKLPMKSLEELSIIVEVLEEDLKTRTSSRCPSSRSLCDLCQDQGDKYWCEDACTLADAFPPTPGDCAVTEELPMHSAEPHDPYPSSYREVTAPFSGPQWRCSSCELAYCIHRAESGIIYSPTKSEYQVPSPQETSYLKPKMDNLWPSSESPSYQCSVQEEWNNMTFFCTQMERDEKILKNISDQELFLSDEHGRTLLHRAVDEGKRALVYVIAKRMAHLKKLDIKDTEGKTPLHLAAQRNQHHVVADLLSLGANINERDQNGKTCVHLSAEYGYVRVLEVMKSYMINGTYIDLEARDVNGLTSLQQASVALKSTLRELEKSTTASQARLNSLRKDQMMETLECLLQMECNPHLVSVITAQPRERHQVRELLHKKALHSHGSSEKCFYLIKRSSTP